jgi:hypothetical protein
LYRFLRNDVLCARQDDDDEDVTGNNYKRRTLNLLNSVATAAVSTAAAVNAAGISSSSSITGSVHAKVLAQAQAISAALAARTAVSVAPNGIGTGAQLAPISITTVTSSATTNSADTSGLKRLVDQIPTTR